MKKQYTYREKNFGKYRIYLYHDGELVESGECWADELGKEIYILEQNGYELGYTYDEIEVARQRYEYVLERKI